MRCYGRGGVVSENLKCAIVPLLELNMSLRNITEQFYILVVHATCFAERVKQPTAFRLSDDDVNENPLISKRRRQPPSIA